MSNKSQQNGFEWFTRHRRTHNCQLPIASMRLPQDKNSFLISVNKLRPTYEFMLQFAEDKLRACATAISKALRESYLKNLLITADLLSRFKHCCTKAISKKFHRESLPTNIPSSWWIHNSCARKHQVPSILISICQNYRQQLIHFALVAWLVFRGHRCGKF